MSTLPLRATQAAKLPLLLLIPAILAFVAYSVFPRGGRTNPAEAFAARHMLDIYDAQKSYAAAHAGNYAESLDTLQLSPADPQYVYRLAASRDSQGRVNRYLATADPREPGKVGTRYFSVDQTGTVHYEFMRPPNKWSPTLQR